MHRIIKNLKFKKEVGIDYICDQVWENPSYPHILYFEKYEFEVLNALFFSCGTMQSHQIYYSI